MTDQRFDLIVIGGGVFGLGTAVEAARRGRRTLVVDRRAVPNPIAASYGPSRKIRSTYLDPHYSRLAVEAMAEWRRIEIPSANGHATALALARLMGALADGGMLDGRSVLSPAAILEASRERIAGPDLVLPFVMSWGAGFMRNAPVKAWGPGRLSFGHSGWGGSCAFADPETRLAGAYVMNRQSSQLLGDARPKRLIEAAYAAL